MMSDLLEQSVIYQDIMQRGIPLGELKILLMQLEHRFGKLARPMQKQIEDLPITQVEALGKALFQLTSKEDLRGWLKQQSAPR